jgi:mitotic spindle assembly checkpoint protein MAD1
VVISLGIMAGLADVAYWRLKMQQLEKESQAEIAELRNALLESDSLRQQAEARAVAAEAEVADATLKLKRTERKVALLTMERDGLKAIVESYDHEEAPVSSQQQQQQQPGSPNTPQKKMRDMRIKELEAALADSQLHVTQLEDALAQSSHASNSSLSKAETEDLNEVYEKLKCLERECDRLRQEAAILESKLGHGDFDSSKTKVLHLIKNLEAEFHIDEHHEALQAEVNALRERVKLLEQNGEITGL